MLLVGLAKTGKFWAGIPLLVAGMFLACAREAATTIVARTIEKQ